MTVQIPQHIGYRASGFPKCPPRIPRARCRAHPLKSSATFLLRARNPRVVEVVADGFAAHVPELDALDDLEGVESRPRTQSQLEH